MWKFQKFKKKPVKQAIIEILSQATVPHCVDRIYMKLRRKFSSVDDATIYKWCMELVEEGLVNVELVQTSPHNFHNYFTIKPD